MSFGVSGRVRGTYDNVVADPCSDFGERVGRARRDEDNVGPPTELLACRNEVRCSCLVSTYTGDLPRCAGRDPQSFAMTAESVERDQRDLWLHVPTIRKLTAHSSASVQTRTRPSDSCSISSAEKKCVDDFEATTWTSTLAYCSQKESNSEPSKGAKP